MVPILLLLTGLAQSTLSKPVMPGQFQSAAELDQREVAGTSGTQVPPNTCAFPVEGTGPVPDDCHRVIDYFSQLDRTGYIEFQGNQCLTKTVDSCSGHVCNTSGQVVRINEARLAWEMTVRLFPCVYQGGYGIWDGDGDLLNIKAYLYKAGGGRPG